MNERQILLKNRRTGESLRLALSEFKTKFRMELISAINTYKAHEEQKNMWMPPFMQKNTNYEHDFYFNLRWNFNSHSTSAWYIERIL